MTPAASHGKWSATTLVLWTILATLCLLAAEWLVPVPVSRNLQQILETKKESSNYEYSAQDVLHWGFDNTVTVHNLDGSVKSLRGGARANHTECPLTIVTAWFPLLGGNQESLPESNLLGLKNIDACLVIYTDPNLLPGVQWYLQRDNSDDQRNNA